MGDVPFLCVNVNVYRRRDNSATCPFPSNHSGLIVSVSRSGLSSSRRFGTASQQIARRCITKAQQRNERNSIFVWEEVKAGIAERLQETTRCRRRPKTGTAVLDVRPRQ